MDLVRIVSVFVAGIGVGVVYMVVFMLMWRGRREPPEDISYGRPTFDKGPRAEV